MVCLLIPTGWLVNNGPPFHRDSLWKGGPLFTSHPVFTRCMIWNDTTDTIFKLIYILQNQEPETSDWKLFYDFSSDFSFFQIIQFSDKFGLPFLKRFLFDIFVQKSPKNSNFFYVVKIQKKISRRKSQKISKKHIRSFSQIFLDGRSA